MTRLFLTSCVVWLLCSASCQAAEYDTGVTSRGGLGAIDWSIICLYAMSTIGLGWYFGRRQKSTQEYFVGTGQMSPLLIGVSLFATLLSTISYLSMPGEALGKGPVNMVSLAGLPIVFFVVGYVLLPAYMKHRVTSAYELLEMKLGLSVRLLGSGMFIVLRLVWMSLLIFLTAKAMTIMLGVGDEYIPLVAGITGAVAVIYTSLGGLQAVVITDFMQTVLLYGGALLVIATVTIDLGGFGWVPISWQDNWDTQPLLPTDLSTRVTVVGSILNLVVWRICTAGGDQVSVQRFMATENAQAARRAAAVQLIVTFVVVLTLGLVGFALLGYFKAHPELLPPEMSLNDGADKVFPHFIAFHLPTGVSGLVVAAMFAAAMSSIDSGVNSITAVVTTDWMQRFGRLPKSERGHIALARWLAFGIGTLVVTCSSFLEHVPGNITAVTTRTANLLSTPIFCLFFFALFVPFASTVGVWTGAICGTVTACLTAFSGPLFGTVPGTDLDPISFQWIGPVAIVVNIVAGCVASLLFPDRISTDGSG